MTEVSIILISRNQEWNIARLIESVLRETAHYASLEIMLVDSASTDRTTEIAAQYPISVLKLHSDQHLSASAGRYVGIKHTTGDLVLFLDGDMELYSGWLDQAIEVMNIKPDVGVVCGRVIDRPKEMETSNLERHELLPVNVGEVISVQHGGGAAMYRRSIFDKVGTFNPYLFSDEEPELCLRIRHIGYRILQLSHPIVFHYSTPADAIFTLFHRRSRKLWLGFGQNIRYHFDSPLLVPYLKERGWVLAPVLILLVGIAAFLLRPIRRQWIWWVFWIIIVCILLTGIAFRKKSLRKAVFGVLQRLLILEGTFRGLILKPHDPENYPARYDLIR